MVKQLLKIKKVRVVVEKGPTQQTFLKSQGKFFFVISMYPFFTYFWHLKITNRAFKK